MSNKKTRIEGWVKFPNIFRISLSLIGIGSRDKINADDNG